LLYRYRLYTSDGDEAGEAHYAVMIQPDEVIWTGDGRKLRVLDLVPEDGDSLYAGLLMVELA
jgi:hypothetical protein